MTEIYYQWKQLVDVDEENNALRQNSKKRLLIGSLLFDTTESACQALVDYDCQEEAINDHWLLVKTSYELVESYEELKILQKSIEGGQ